MWSPHNKQLWTLNTVTHLFFPFSPKWCHSPGLYWLLFLISTPGSGASLSQGGIPRLLLASKRKRCGQTVKECWWGAVDCLCVPELLPLGGGDVLCHRAECPVAHDKQGFPWRETLWLHSVVFFWKNGPGEKPTVIASEEPPLTFSILPLLLGLCPMHVSTIQ